MPLKTAENFSNNTALLQHFYDDKIIKIWKSCQLIKSWFMAILSSVIYSKFLFTAKIVWHNLKSMSKIYRSNLILQAQDRSVSEYNMKLIYNVCTYYITMTFNNIRYSAMKYVKRGNSWPPNYFLHSTINLLSPTLFLKIIITI